ncbi:Zinc/cadmium/lead-transporting P-type ATPase [Oligella urethralis]|uniref:heavy metal translocating P-type ATPase n=1 Tax=Oligella urethralis TaxID=90245 RepID=UPI002958DF47|nr:heavy metal translocating P-type ATPase [Oligella urethralis]WOS38754.1 Zinc/cadmium/lead-transporting P-type ATPase [Oligella urethralis]
MRFHVEGMDCGSCAAKIETAVARLAGVSDIQINFANEKLDLSLDPNATTQPDDIIKTIKKLGYGVSTDNQSSTTENATSSEDTRWWQTRKGKQVISLGLLMAAAYIVSLLFPAFEMWAFGIAVLIGVLPFARNAIALAKAGTPFSIEMLMSVAALGALVIGETEEAAAVVFLFSVGELLEGVAASRARSGIKSLAALVPSTAILLDPQGEQREVPVASLQANDLILVRPGDRVAADGSIAEGSSSLDESPITGESIPLHKTTGDSVYAGSVNVDGVLQVRVEKTSANNTIARIIHLVEEAQANKAPTARFIEQFSRYYTPAVMAIAALIVWVPPLAMGGDWMTWLYRGLALLLIACPCALVLSTPAAIASGLAAGTRHGLLVKGGSALETIGKVDTIAFDKTGTLTEGKPIVTDIVAFDGASENDVLALCAAVETGSSHPLATAIVNRATESGVSTPAASNASATAGKAVRAEVAGHQLAIASPVHAVEIATLTDEQTKHISALQTKGKTVSVLLDEQNHIALGLVALRDEAREDAQEGVAALKSMGVHAIMLTGDNRRTAQAIADKLGLGYEAELLPQDKLRLINEMKSEGKVAMVGDGINDAPALATADVGIAMGGGTDVAMETADAALMKSRVTDVAQLVALSRATMANIRQNVAFAVGLKGVFLITTVLGFTGLWVAVLADTGATALVTLNALRLLRFKGVKKSVAASDKQPDSEPLKTKAA